MISRGLRTAAAVLTLTVMAITTGLAQDYPARPIRVIGPFPAGSGPDVDTRSILAELSKVLGQSVVMENRPGASGIIGTEAGIKATPDGYTLLVGSTNNMAVVPALYSKLPYNVERDVTPVSLTGILSVAMLATTGLAQTSVKELIAQLKAQPDSLAAGTFGVGSAQHIWGEWFGFSSATKIRFIPYSTSAPFADLVSGQVQLVFDAMPASIGNIRAGKLKVLALTGKARHPRFPDVPTFAEAGLPEYSPAAWLGVVAPAGTPKPIIDKLSAAMRQAAGQNPALIDRWQSVGGELKATSPEEFGTFIQSELDRMRTVSRQTNIKLD